MTAVGFEPTRIAPPELESGALDHSAKLSWVLMLEFKGMTRIEREQDQGRSLGMQTMLSTSGHCHQTF